MGVREILAERTKKRVRWAVLRPVDAKRREEALAKLPQRPLLDGEMTSEKLNRIIRDSLEGGFLVVGFLKPKCRKLFDRHGFETGHVAQPGDVLDDIEDFRRRVKDLTYRKTNRSFKPAPAGATCGYLHEWDKICGAPAKYEFTKPTPDGDKIVMHVCEAHALPSITET